MCLTSFARGDPASSEAKATPARIGPTVWEEEGPMPTRNRSTTESGRGETDEVGLVADTDSACITQLFHLETLRAREPGKPRHPTSVSRQMG